MPYKFEYEKIHLPRGKDRRIKLTDSQREEIRDKYSTGEYSTYKLADSYNVSRRTIQFVIYPERYEKAREMNKKRSKGGTYYDTKKNTLAKREHRKYKQKILKEKE